MDFVLAHPALEQRTTDCLVIGIYEGGKLSPAALQIDRASSHAIEAVLRGGDFDGDLGAVLLLARIPDVAAARILLVGLGAEADFAESRYAAALCAATTMLRTTGAAEATLCLAELPVGERDIAWKVEQAALAVMDGLYRFDTLKSEPPKKRCRLTRIAFPVADRAQAPAVEAALARATAIAAGIALAKDLGNLPGNICTPKYLAGQAQELGRRHGLEVKILDPQEIAALGMKAFLAVASGSSQPPQFIVVEYHGGTRGAPPVVLVGKGITFDTGGLNIKSSAEMAPMKFDMCGAASVLGALHAAALLRLPLDVVGIIAAAENMPDGNAIKPGDVVTTMSGQTVEILDTDSEGRLVLADALTYAERYKPAVLLDVATLTGAIEKALGDIGAGVFADSDALVREVLEAGDRAWDRAWHMPLWPEYQDRFKSSIADFANVGPEDDCAITAACFLSRFTRRYPWVHLDIAGIAAKSGEDGGASGRPVALLVHFLAARAGNSMMKTSGVLPGPR
jgi:leucyl aminopeptidase